MLMEAMLIKSLFSKPQSLPGSRAEGSTTLSRYAITSTQKGGTAIWTRQGEWIKDSSSQKLRLMLSDNPQTFIAVQSEKPDKSLYQKVRDHLTHLSVQSVCKDGTSQSVSLNIGSLSKRTQLSIATLFLMWITGRLTLEYIEKNARIVQQSNELFERIIQNGRARAIAMGMDPKEKEKELREVLQTALKCRRLAKGLLIERGQLAYIAHKDKNNRFTLEEKGSMLGEGSYGIVFEVFNLGTGESEALKFAKKADKKSGIKNESTILNIVHCDGRVKGVQHAPHFVIDLFHPDYNLGYVTTKYDYNLNALDFLKLTPMLEKVNKIGTLFNGLFWLHEKNIVHCDIKPANCCSENGELQLADFGHARLCENVTPEQPLGVCTPYFRSESDEWENKRITLAYCLHQIAIGKVKNPIAAAWILQSAIEHPTLKIDRQAAKFTIAWLLLKVSNEKLNTMGIATDPYKKEMDILKNNPAAIKTRKLKLVKYKMTKAQMEQLKKESHVLCKQHDVYGLAVTVVCILLGIRFVSPAALPSALSKLSKSPELAAVNPGLCKLLKDMLNKDGAKRPSIKEAMDRYCRIVKSNASVQLAKSTHAKLT